MHFGVEGKSKNFSFKTLFCNHIELMGQFDKHPFTRLTLFTIPFACNLNVKSSVLNSVADNCSVVLSDNGCVDLLLVVKAVPDNFSLFWTAYEYILLLVEDSSRVLLSLEDYV